MWVMMMMMVMVVVVPMDDHYDLRLRRIGYREAEEKGDSAQNLFHSLVSCLLNLNTELL